VEGVLVGVSARLVSRLRWERETERERERERKRERERLVIFDNDRALTPTKTASATL